MENDRPGFWDQFREDPIVLVGPLLALAPIVALALAAPWLGG